MQTNTDFSVPDFFAKYEKPLFWLSGLMAVACFLAGIYYHFELLFVLPFALLFPALLILNFRIVFFLMLFVMPVSVETYLGSFGTDLPSEPLVMVLAVCTLFYLIFHYDEIKNPAYKHPIVELLLVMY